MKFWSFPGGPHEPSLHRNPVKRSFACQWSCYLWHGAPFNVGFDGHKSMHIDVHIEVHVITVNCMCIWIKSHGGGNYLSICIISFHTYPVDIFLHHLNCTICMHVFFWDFKSTESKVQSSFSDYILKLSVSCKSLSKGDISKLI